jgi:deoxyribonucleoside regulator
VVNTDRSVLYRIARQYYIENLTQEEIARQLHVSRGYVSRLLQRCMEENIVQVHIQYPFLTNTSLEQDLRKQFGLKDAMVVVPEHNSETLAAIGRAGAYYLQTVLGQEDVLGLSWGTSLWQVAHHLTGWRALNLEVVQLVGGLTYTAAGTQPNELVRSFALALSGTPVYLPAPLFVDAEETARALCEGSIVGNALRKARTATVALVGIGAVVPNASLFRGAGFPLDMVIRLQELGAVGDICGRFFCADGSPCHSELDARTMTLTHEDLHRIPLVIGIAAGDIKTQAILGALRGKLITVLITDEATASHVLTHHRVSHPAARSS